MKRQHDSVYVSVYFYVWTGVFYDVPPHSYDVNPTAVGHMGKVSITVHVILYHSRDTQNRDVVHVLKFN